jgi:formamidopyrimidine-DNA glycosylase
MPELPEVETVRKGLEERLVGRAITGFDVRLAKQFKSDPALIKTQIIGAQIEAMERRAKLLLIHLSSGYSLLIHLKMTGQLIWQDASGERFAGGHPIPFVTGPLPSGVTHIVFTFDDGSKLFFNDLRQLGYASLVPTSEVPDLKFLKSLSPEPFSKEFTLERFATQLKRRGRSRIKTVLLDQAVAAGVGNIYADEALFLAKVHPERLAGSLDLDEVERLWKAVPEVLRESLRWGGTSIQAYIDPDGKRGTYLDHAYVYRRTGEPCRDCGTPIEKIIVGGRGTHFCPHCQRVEGST